MDQSTQRTSRRVTIWVLGAWFVATTGMGSVLMSFHQPFQTPDGQVLGLFSQDHGRRWRLLHVLSAGCGCSQKVIEQLVERHPIPGAGEEILLVDGSAAELPGTAERLRGLTERGYAVRHITEAEAGRFGLHGVPLLLVESPGGKLAYAGGYGSAGDGASRIFAQIRRGGAVQALPILGCAVGARLQRQVDPFHMKY